MNIKGNVNLKKGGIVEDTGTKSIVPILQIFSIAYIFINIKIIMVSIQIFISEL